MRAPSQSQNMRGNYIFDEFFSFDNLDIQKSKISFTSLIINIEEKLIKL